MVSVNSPALERVLAESFGRSSGLWVLENKSSAGGIAAMGAPIPNGDAIRLWPDATRGSTSSRLEKGIFAFDQREIVP